MANLVFPQLASGALAQYPIRKSTAIRTIKNILADGTMLVAADPGAGKLVWTLSYVNLSVTDLNALQSHFKTCAGPLRSFTFLDPTDNLLQNSADLTGPGWATPATITIQTGIPDPMGGNLAFTVTNAGPVPQLLAQSITGIPAGYQYCFSIYASSVNSEMCGLIRSGPSSQQVNVYSIASRWSRIHSSGKLNDPGMGLTVAISLEAGQSASLFGPQFEAQLAPSRFRPTYSTSGVYLNAHWGIPEFIFTADAPNLFSTSFSIETSV